MVKHLVDIDDDRLAAARAELGTTTIKDTVNVALTRATSDRNSRVAAALDVIAGADIDGREQGWR